MDVAGGIGAAGVDRRAGHHWRGCDCGRDVLWAADAAGGSGGDGDHGGSDRDRARGRRDRGERVSTDAGDDRVGVVVSGWRSTVAGSGGESAAPTGLRLSGGGFDGRALRGSVGRVESDRARDALFRGAGRLDFADPKRSGVLERVKSTRRAVSWSRVRRRWLRRCGDAGGSRGDTEGVDLRGELFFQFKDGYALECSVFVATDCEGELIETDEAKPIWTRLEEIPFGEMWADDVHWLPGMLEGRCFRGYFSSIWKKCSRNT